MRDSHFTKTILDEIIDKQVSGSFLLTGLFLGSDDQSAIANELAVDDPDTGALGRYRGVPVFDSSEFMASVNTSCHRGVSYSFVPMAVVN